MVQERKQHGGARPGSGRKKDKPRVQVCFRIEEELMDKISEISSNKNKFVNAAIREKLERMAAFIKEVEELE